ncbi:hypothetical protein PX699_29885 [Sphingobium sp. H39-3-25]|uniref:hypothetical protein n=1 Tax=Sphingobium arseniciresistens TaxID=3030834 RepID=UPI0023B9AEE6|nr:hypothetical protein [Sphingobium arseniciresistens]
MYYAATSLLTFLLATAPPPGAIDHAKSQAADAAGRPSQVRTLAATDNLNRLTCADFLATASVAASRDTGDAALAAQDEISNGLIWLHGYLYAAKGGHIEVLSQQWMTSTARRVFEVCSKAQKPKETTLFEVVVP